jgi:proteasome lid subunit RPN8/RPN11
VACDAAKEHVVGWYSTGPKLRENDLDIHALFNKYGSVSYSCTLQ